MNQFRRVVECENCGCIAVVTPVSEDTIRFCSFCGSDKLADQDESDE